MMEWGNVEGMVRDHDQDQDQDHTIGQDLDDS